MECPIDFIMIWVDGNDPEWQKEKRKYQPGDAADDREIRYRDWDNLQYWFRAVEKFAPWVNRIHFVTCGHLPKWLNLEPVSYTHLDVYKRQREGCVIAAKIYRTSTF